MLSNPSLPGYFEPEGLWTCCWTRIRVVGGWDLSEHLKTAPKMGSTDHRGTWSPTSDPPCWQFNAKDGGSRGLPWGLTTSSEPNKDCRQTQHVVQTTACKASKLFPRWKEKLAMTPWQGNLSSTRSSWLNCALWDDEAVYWVSIGHSKVVAVGNWWYWVSRGYSCLYILHKMEIWLGVTDAWRTDGLWKIGLLSSL